MIEESDPEELSIGLNAMADALGIDLSNGVSEKEAAEIEKLKAQTQKLKTETGEIGKEKPLTPQDLVDIDLKKARIEALRRGSGNKSGSDSLKLNEAKKFEKFVSDQALGKVDRLVDMLVDDWKTDEVTGEKIPKNILLLGE